LYISYKMKRTKSKQSHVVMVLAIVILVFMIVFFLTDVGYFTAYTVDYLLNRHNYKFKEEAQYGDNRITQTDSILTTYMNSIRDSKLAKMPKIPSEPLPEIDVRDLTKEKVLEISNHFREPFIVRGLIRDFDCVQKWNLEYFETEYGDVDVPVLMDDKPVSYSKGKATPLKKCNSDNHFCSIREICKSIRNGEPLYINNISKLFTVSDQARAELNLDKMSQIMNESFFKNEKKNVFMSQLFFGGKNTGTSLHSASNINFFFNVKGTKHWGFIHPKYTSLIKCQTSDKGLFAVSADDFFSEKEDNPYLRIPRYEALLNSGDFLFNPPWYWHAVKNKTDYTIAVANRYMVVLDGEVPSMSNNYFYTFLQLFSPSHYAKVIYPDKDQSYQDYYGELVDKEVLDNLTQKDHK